MKLKTVVLSVLVLTLAAMAQNYRCDWSVVGSGGGHAGSTSFQVDATAGQTATGFLTGSQFLAVIGFWQADYGVGIAEQEPGTRLNALETGLQPPAPNPFASATRIRYSLAARSHVRLGVYDLSGRLVSTLVDAGLAAGRYELSWRPVQGSRRLPAGVYFLRMTTDEEEHIRRLLIAR